MAETLSYLFSSYLETGYISPVEAMRVVMKNLKGHFTLMALVTKGKCLMVGCRDYPLVIGKDNPTVYFGTETLAQFSPSMIDLATLRTKFQSEILSQVSL